MYQWSLWAAWRERYKAVLNSDDVVGGMVGGGVLCESKKERNVLVLVTTVCYTTLSLKTAP